MAWEVPLQSMAQSWCARRRPTAFSTGSSVPCPVPTSLVYGLLGAGQVLSTEALDKYLLLKSMTRCQELVALKLWSQKRPGVTVRNGLHSRRTLLPHGCLWEATLWWGAQGLPRFA